MTRKVRFKQVLRYRCGKGMLYTNQVHLQRMFWKEDKSPTPTIEKVRKIHSYIGTWDSHTKWRSWGMSFKKGKFNRIILRDGKVIFPKVKYRPIKRALEVNDMRRAEEFFESQGV